MIIAICNVVIVEDHVEIPTGLYVHPTLLNLFQVIARMFYKVGSSYLLATGPLLCWRNAIYVKRVIPFFLTFNDVSPRAILFGVLMLYLLAYE